MSRSRLFTRIRRSLRLAQAANHAGMPADEVVGQSMERVVGPDHDRRRAIKLMGLAGGQLALAAIAPRLLASPVQRPSVVVVGAGIAGLTAAYRLQQAGVRVDLIEAQQRVGGRIFSLRGHFSNGQVAELGGELIDTQHTHMRSLARELGIPLDDYQDDDASLDHDVWFFDSQRFTDVQMVDAFRPIAADIERSLSTIPDVDAIGYRHPVGARALDLMSITDWFDHHGVSGWMRDALSVAYATENGLDPERQSSLNLLTMIDTHPNPFQIFGESDERFHVRGGNDSITRTLARRLGDAVETDTAVEAIRQRIDGCFELSLVCAGVPRRRIASHVILAVPNTMLRRMRIDVPMSTRKRRAIHEIPYGTNAKLMVEFSARPWRTEHRSNGSIYTDLALQTTWETSRLQAGSNGVITNFVGGRHGVDVGRLTPAKQAARLVAGLEHIYPGIGQHRSGMKEARFHWPSQPWALGSYMCLSPGHWTSFLGVLEEPVGRLFFAGEHTSQEAQGFMEGGCESGQRAAREVLASLGIAHRMPAVSA